MWLFTRYGFYSVVCTKIEPGKLMVRGRNPEHLKNLKNKFPQLQNCEIVETEDADYCCRIFVPQSVWAEVAKQLALDIDYSNFKNAVKDHDYHDTLTDTWSTMYHYQCDLKHGKKSRFGFGKL